MSAEFERVQSPSTRKKILTAPQDPLFPLARRLSKDGKHKLWFDRNGFPACTTFQRIGGKICALCGNTCITFKVNQDDDIICSACAFENSPVVPATA